MFRQFKINLPFIEALQHMPKYAKFLKDLLKRKDRLGEVSSIPHNGDCSAVVFNRVPERLSDTGVFMIPFLFGSDMMSQALAELELGDLTPTRMSLSLEDRWVKYPRGIIETLPVKVHKFVFPVDFVVLGMEADERVPITLGCLFLRTAKALIIVYDGRITIRVGDENVTYDVARSMKHPGFDICLDYICGGDLVGVGEDEELKEEVVEESSYLVDIMEVSEVLCEKDAKKIAPLELKVLLSHLEYAYLEKGSNLPVIVSSKLMEEEKMKLIEVLKLRKWAIAWRLSDI
ncbi:uncharacterized protein LOC143551154 [Bidens hawaiensis]|uniref:uncharacterized protein LOC143551154 n=1 Tax=Bidens hawaiensis TaxID=980011 RepID=UPI00404B604D